jgi:hypothetical protein
MQGNVTIGEALCLPGVIERIVSNISAIDGDKHILSLRSTNKAHVISKPALDPSALVIIGTSTLLAIVVTTLKAVNIELAHIGAYALEVFYQFAI